MMKQKLSLGIDVGSTTVKAVVIDQNNQVLYSNYVRHGSKVKEVTLYELDEIRQKVGQGPYTISFTGSSGLGLSERAHLPFVQEVESAYLAVKKIYPEVDAVIELGGEDAKIIFISGGLEERMNGSCAGGTGAFIDQMAMLLNLNLGEMDQLSFKAEKAYPIASRCGVFAKSDVQAILNQGASKADIALSIFYAVADQTIAGLAQGREIKGNVLFLGGPLFFLAGLRRAFKDRLNLDDKHALFASDADTFMAKGAAIYAANSQTESLPLDEIINHVKKVSSVGDVISGEPLFKNEKAYEEFIQRHKDFDVKEADISTYKGNAYLGIDEGSTTTKIVLLSENNEVLYSHYEPNNGLPIDKIVNQLKHIYSIASPDMKIISSAVTGYGEDLIMSALHVDYGLVETVAHFKAASFFEPKVEFILDIGGQDIKCFKIRDGAIDSIMLNEACSSGCGSFLQTFAQALNYDIDTFSKIGLFAKHPVELGSRCTVFMNSSVKQSQRDGATIEDISAGLSRSVVKNALYKVIRVHSFEELGERIVCQGGTFLNNAVLRAFEMEIGHEVIRPSIAGLMGAFGAALYAKEKGAKGSLISKEDLDKFTYTTRRAVCQGCTSHCALTVLTFPDKGVFISGNKCEKGAGRKIKSDALDIYAYKRKRLTQIKEDPVNPKAVVGIPLCLGMYEQLPMWDTFFKELGFAVVISPFSTRDLYRRGQKSIPSDTACYPAKLMHGHIDYLLEKGVDFIFYPSESYNVNEKRGDNYFNCPVVAYYGELLKNNDPRLNKENFVDPFVNLNVVKKSVQAIKDSLYKYNLSEKELTRAFETGLGALLKYRNDVKEKGKQIIEEARKENKRIILLAGRPYHIDPEVNHGIDKLLDSLDVAVISEDSVLFDKKLTKTHILNQWTYHARLFDAASYVATQKDMELIHLVSFGCGVDAITSDEVRRILEENNKLYTQLKIDEMANLGAVKIRIRSLIAAVEEKNHE